MQGNLATGVEWNRRFSGANLYKAVITEGPYALCRRL